jgi:hypothetical protein
VTVGYFPSTDDGITGCASDQACISQDPTPYNAACKEAANSVGNTMSNVCMANPPRHR